MYTFPKSPPVIFRFVTLPQKLQRKQAFILRNSAKLCDTTWKFQVQKPSPMEIPPCFIKYPWKFYFFFNWPLEFPYAFSSVYTTRNSISSTPTPPPRLNFFQNSPFFYNFQNRTSFNIYMYVLKKDFHHQLSFFNGLT